MEAAAVFFGSIVLLYSVAGISDWWWRRRTGFTAEKPVVETDPHYEALHEWDTAFEAQTGKHINTPAGQIDVERTKAKQITVKGTWTELYAPGLRAAFSETWENGTFGDGPWFKTGPNTYKNMDTGEELEHWPRLKSLAQDPNRLES